MISAVPLGLIAACVVLFFPMGMVGHHLNHNKMIFFSCVLFITLAVGIHLTLYSPLISFFLHPPQATISPNPDSCVSLLHNVTYNDTGGCEGDYHPSIDCKKSWDWVETGRGSECGFRKLKKPDASDLLNGSWVVVAGDSQARLTAVSFLQLLVGAKSADKMRGDLFKLHAHYSTVVEDIGMRFDFIWAPYVTNLTKSMQTLKINKTSPDVMVLSAGLWDMLHINNASEYGDSLRELKNEVFSLLPVSLNPEHLLHLFWVGMPTLVNYMLNTDAKREKMTEVMCRLYEDELRGSQILREFGGPFLKLDVCRLSGLCGVSCTGDGMHYDGVVYDAAVQIMLNALLIESNKKP